MNMDKPILIDALHINMGGALMILNHLVDHLVIRKINFILLKDNRCPKLHSEHDVPQIITMSSGERIRRRYYKSHQNSFSTVFCMGNIPPAIKMPVTVHTYIHNVSLLKIPKDYSVSQKAKNYLKREYIRFYAKNTDTWIVQTSNTANLVNNYINQLNLPVLEFPFYNIPENINHASVAHRQDYVFIGEHTGAKGHEYLVEAWGILAQQGIRPKLHLTSNSLKLKNLIAENIKLGARIENHGYVSFAKVIELYNKSKATIYPSLNESLGLGIIEAVEAGCDVIGCDLPYVYAVCKPTLTFQPRNAQSIANAVSIYEAGGQTKTTLKIKDLVEEFIDFILINITKSTFK